MRRLFGVLTGILVAFLLVAGTDFLSGTLFPAGDVDTADPAVIAAFIAGMPFPAKLIVVAGWLIAPLGGAWLCLRVADWAPGGWVVTAAFLVGGLFNQLTLPHPRWMQLCAVVLPLAGGWLAQRLHARPYPGEALLG